MNETERHKLMTIVGHLASRADAGREPGPGYTAPEQLQLMAEAQGIDQATRALCEFLLWSDQSPVYGTALTEMRRRCIESIARDAAEVRQRELGVLRRDLAALQSKIVSGNGNEEDRTRLQEIKAEIHDREPWVPDF